MFTPDVDALYQQALSSSDNGKTMRLVIGDRDGDCVLDSEERTNGTNWDDIKNYGFNLSLTYSGVFQTTNALVFEVRFGTNTLWGPLVVYERTWTCDFESLVTTNKEPLNIFVWDDTNHNLMLDVNETSNSYVIDVVGGSMVITNRLTLGNFDRDNDGMLDAWEIQYGLSPLNPADAMDDLDHDSFINLHEYWAGTCPTNALENGDGTALYAAVHGVDDRLANADPVRDRAYILDSNKAYLWTDNIENSGFSINTNCWMSDVDITCLSLCSSVNAENWPWPLPVTAISPIHVITATHMVPSNGIRYAFMSSCCETFVRTVIATKVIEGVAEGDLCIGVLDQPLPSSIHPAKFLPKQYSDWLADGCGIPLVRIGRDKTCNVGDVEFLAPSQLRNRMIKLNQSAKSPRSQYWRGPLGCDSGNPMFLLVGGEMVYLCPARGYYYGENVATGYLCTFYMDKIQNAMNVLSVQNGHLLYSVQEYDFSSYDKLLYGR